MDHKRNTLTKRIEVLHRRLLADYSLNLSKSGRKRPVNPRLYVHYRIGEAVNDYRDTYADDHDKVCGMAWVDELGARLGGQFGQGYLYLHRRYFKLFELAEVRAHVLASVPARELSRLCAEKRRQNRTR